MLIPLIVALLVASSADATVLCARPKKDGTFSTSVKIREACKANETRLDPDALGLRGPAGPAGRGMTIFDANGAYVAMFERGSGNYNAVRRIGDTLVGFVVEPSTVGGCGEYEPIFSTSDCTGPARVQFFGDPADGGTLTPVYTWADTSGLLYFAKPPYSSTTIGARLVRYLDQPSCVGHGGTFTPPDLCCRPLWEGATVGEPATFDLNSLGLVPPFHTEGP